MKLLNWLNFSREDIWEVIIVVGSKVEIENVDEGVEEILIISYAGEDLHMASVEILWDRSNGVS